VGTGGAPVRRAADPRGRAIQAARSPGASRGSGWCGGAPGRCRGAAARRHGWRGAGGQGLLEEPWGRSRPGRAGGWRMVAGRDGGARRIAAGARRVPNLLHRPSRCRAAAARGAWHTRLGRRAGAWGKLGLSPHVDQAAASEASICRCSSCH
jgi:hypothetical protein